MVFYALASVLDQYKGVAFGRDSRAAGDLFLILFLLVNPAVGLAVLAIVLAFWARGAKGLKGRNLHHAVWLACLNVVEPVLLLVTYALCCFAR